MGKYDDIIHLPHYQSPHRAHMPLSDRAAQFAPFAALNGYGAAILETARLTEQKIELTDSEKAALDLRLQLLSDHLPDRPEITLTYFQPDARKEGGAYTEETGVVKKIDTYERVIVMESGAIIPIGDVCRMTGAIFRPLEDTF